MESVKFEGPSGQVSREVGQATGEGDMLEPGRVYELPDELVDRLCGSSQAWRRVRAPRKPKETAAVAAGVSEEPADE